MDLRPDDVAFLLDSPRVVACLEQKVGTSGEVTARQAVASGRCDGNHRSAVDRTHAFRPRLKRRDSQEIPSQL